MDVFKMTSYLILTIFLVIAVVQDMHGLKVSNRLILLGFCAAVPLRIMWGGVENIVWALPNIILPVVILYLFYLSGALGAADIKLFSLVGSFISLKELIYCVGISFVLGALFSLAKMLHDRTFQARMTMGLMYIYAVMQGEIRAYEMVDDENVIHFSAMILFGVMITSAIFLKP